MGGWLVLERRNPRRVGFKLWRTKLRHHLLLRRRGGSGRLGPNLRRHPPRRPSNTSAVRLCVLGPPGGAWQHQRVSRRFAGGRWKHMGRPARHVHVRPRPVDFWRAFRMRSIQAEHGNVSRLVFPLLLSGRLVDVHGKLPLPTHLRQAGGAAAAVAAAATAVAVWLPRVGRRRLPGADQSGHRLPNGRASRRHAGRRLGNHRVPTAEAEF